jgi:ABC-type molybdenum transport system ATPase subunit/photorepair protein PhrA
LGQAVGTVDVRELRRQIGIVSASLEARMPPSLKAIDVVAAGATGAIAPWSDRAVAPPRPDPSSCSRIALTNPA